MTENTNGTPKGKKIADRTVYATREEALAAAPAPGAKVPLRLRPISKDGITRYTWAGDGFIAVYNVAKADGYTVGEPCDAKYIDPLEVAGGLDSKQLTALLKAAKAREKAATTAASGAVAASEKVEPAETPSENAA